MSIKIKVCGITKQEELDMLQKYQVDFLGMVLFYPKSKRNISLEQAKKLLGYIEGKTIKKVAVTVSPTVEQIKEIQTLSFDYIQIHGELTKESFEAVKIPILRAFNGKEMKLQKKYQNLSKVHGYVFDGANPGGGKTFDWSRLQTIKLDNKLFILAGGLHAGNVEDAIQKVLPDVVDVSSGVEGENGKDENKIKEFVERVKEIQYMGGYQDE